MAGGMDQTASIFGQDDHALMIEFNPIRVTPVKMPSDAAVIVADSLEVADKSGRVREEYNRRVVECAIAARILAQSIGLARVRVLGDVVRQLAKWKSDDLAQILAN